MKYAVPLAFILILFCPCVAANLEALEEDIKKSGVLDSVAISNYTAELGKEDIAYEVTVTNKRQINRDIAVLAQLERIDDDTVSARTSEVISLKKGETINHEGTLQIDLCNASYFLRLNILGTNNIVLDSQRIAIDGNDDPCLIFEPSLAIIAGELNYSRDIDKGTSLMLPKELVPINENIHVQFGINTTETTENLTIHADLLTTHDQLAVWHLEDNIDRIEEHESFRFPLDLGYEGTFELRISLFHNTDLVAATHKTITFINQSREVSILRVYTPLHKLHSNRDATLYLLTASRTETPAKITLQILSDDGHQTIEREFIVKQGITKNELTFTPEQTLEAFRVVASLNTQDTTLNQSVETSPTQPSLEIGRDNNTVGCFNDGICTEQEREFGECNDCDRETRISKGLNNRSFSWLLIPALLLAALMIYYFRKP
ncbi:MAG: hypothetical protein ACQESG_00995, partial [Nanobdellota archaeon]